MPPKSSFPFYDAAAKGKLTERLKKARAAGQSFETIARLLHDDGIPVTGDTVRQWCIETGLWTATKREAAEVTP